MKEYSVIFWDFDGVIKESVSIKSDVFYELFLPFGDSIAKLVRCHHEANGGMSRFEKMPIYLEMVGEDATDLAINTYCDRFGDLVQDKVVNAPWVPGVKSYIERNVYEQDFILVSATPQVEIENILNMLNFSGHFLSIWGAPTTKSEAIQTMISRQGYHPAKCLMVGDATADLRAANATSVTFMLRRHDLNDNIFVDYNGLSLMDFSSQ